jgi:hypothetical protein
MSAAGVLTWEIHNLYVSLDGEYHQIEYVPGPQTIKVS